MIRRLEGERPAFALETENTSYVMAVSASGHPEHLYYGARVAVNRGYVP